MKLCCQKGLYRGAMVAPFVGAWIETRYCPAGEHDVCVAPFVGAWIETVQIIKLRSVSRVAPFVGAWIETLTFGINGSGKRSLLS